MSQTEKTALGSIVVALVVLGLKAIAFWLTGSVALYSDALESIINVVTALAAFVAVRLSAKPADRNHPYGHQKAEYFAVILEGICIALAAVSILREAAAGFGAPRAIDAPLAGLLVSALATAANTVWGQMLIRWGRRAYSPALIADGRHLMTDVYTSIGVLAGVGLVVLTGILQLDPLIAGLVALNILWSGWLLVKESVAALMDEAAPDAQLDCIQAALLAESGGTIEIHDLKSRTAGRVVFVEFHLVVDGRMSVADSHVICDRLEHALRREIPGAVVTIHVEPEHKAKQTGVMVVS